MIIMYDKEGVDGSRPFPKATGQGKECKGQEKAGEKLEEEEEEGKSGGKDI